MASIYPAPPSGGGNGHEERAARPANRRPALPPPGLDPAPGRRAAPGPGRPFAAGLAGGLLSGALAGALAALLVSILLRRT